MLGNRGILHDETRTVVRTSQVRRWLCCVLEFRGRRRTVMRPHSYTELFFLDEVTAFAAGHRPCFECRRQAALQFQRCWAKAHGRLARADEMDAVLGAQRRVRGGGKKTFLSAGLALPDGAFVTSDGEAWLVHQRHLVRWTPAGYAERTRLGSGHLEVLTPEATVAVLRAGYVPLVHASAST